MTECGGGGLIAKSFLILVTSWTVVCQVPLSMALSRQEYWSGLPFPSPGHLPYPGIELGCLAVQADSLPTELQGKPMAECIWIIGPIENCFSCSSVNSF